MKKIIILIAIICGFGFCKDNIIVVDGNKFIIKDGLLLHITDCSKDDSLNECKMPQAKLMGSVSGSCEYKLSSEKYYDYYYDEDTKELSVFRSCEGTLLFKGRSNDGSGSLIDGYCYDKNGLKETKHVNQIKKCK